MNIKKMFYPILAIVLFIILLMCHWTSGFTEMDNIRFGEGLEVFGNGNGGSTLNTNRYPEEYEEGLLDSDGDGVPDIYEDVDGDGDLDDDDTDGDGIPDYLDPDDDGDGVPTIEEDVDGDGNPMNDDTDGDGIPDYLDSDDDNDGVPTSTELADGLIHGDDVDDDGIPNWLDDDDDGDGIPTATETEHAEEFGNDVDGDGIPNYMDTDSDNDGISDEAEGTGDTDGDGVPDYLDPYDLGGWVLCSTFTGGKDCLGDMTTTGVYVDMGTCLPEGTFQVRFERYWEDAGYCPGKGSSGPTGGKGVQIGSGVFNAVTWYLCDSNYDIANWVVHDYDPTDTFGGGTLIEYMEYDGVTPWIVTVDNYVGYNINEHWQISIYYWTGEGEPAYDVPGFEIFTLAISLGVAFIILKRRKKDDI